MSKAGSTEVLFEDITQFVSQSKALLEQGAMLELNDLDEHVRLLCEQVLALTQEDRLRYADKLQVLLQDLKNLGTELAEKRDAVVTEIRSISNHHKANVAYKMADATDDYGKKDG